MAARVSFRMDFRQFDAALREYMGVTKRTLADVLNKKAYFIARGAMYETPATSRQTIESQLGKVIRVGKNTKIVSLKESASQKGVPLAALLVNRDLGKQGKKGLYGDAMTAAIAKFIMMRVKSRAFLKSGWLPAVKALAHSFKGSSRGVAPMSREAKQYGSAKGRAEIARPGFKCKAIIENFASGPKETHNAIHKYGGPALQRAFDKEALSMKEEVFRRIQDDAKAVGIRVTQYIGIIKGMTK